MAFWDLSNISQGGFQYLQTFFARTDTIYGNLTKDDTNFLAYQFAPVGETDPS